MKQLNSNFTTPEQSRRLLDLGLPANSADGVYELKQIGTKFIMSKTPDIIPQTMRLCWTINSRIPCWSAGRLIEIFAKCKMYSYEDRTTPLQLYADEINGGLVEFLVDIIYNYNDLDFSKLEE